MAAIVRGNHEMLLKFSATVLAISAAVAKLYVYHKDKYDEMKKDIEFYEELKAAYISSAESDEYYAELLSEASAEVDELLNGVE